MSEEIRLCPVAGCGGDGETKSTGAKYKAVTCVKCNYQGPVRWTASDAIVAWNKGILPKVDLDKISTGDYQEILADLSQAMTIVTEKVERHPAAQVTKEISSKVESASSALLTAFQCIKKHLSTIRRGGSGVQGKVPETSPIKPLANLGKNASD